MFKERMIFSGFFFQKQSKRCFSEFIFITEILSILIIACPLPPEACPSLSPIGAHWESSLKHYSTNSPYCQFFFYLYCKFLTISIYFFLRVCYNVILEGYRTPQTNTARRRIFCSEVGISYEIKLKSKRGTAA